MLYWQSDFNLTYLEVSHMHKLLKVSAVGLVTISLGVASLPATTVPALAKTKAAKVLSSKKMSKTAYHANGGYLYSSAKLTKKSHKAFKYLKTTFYATKSVKLKKTNGKTATYYYVKNSKGSVKGWIWKGNLKKINTKALAQRRADIKNTISAVRTMETEDQSSVFDYLSVVTVKSAYDGGYGGLGFAINEIYGNSAKDAQAILQLNGYFKGRFSSVTNAKLKALSDQLVDTIAASEDSSYDSDIYDASTNLANVLGDAVATLD